MGRERFEPGEFGNISVREVGPGIFEAKARFCNPRTGVVSAVTKRGGSRAKATAALKGRLTGGGDSSLGTDSRIGGKDSVAKLASMWARKKTAERKAQSQSMEKYSATLRNHVLPQLGAHQVRHLDVPLVDDFLITLAATAPTEAKRAKAIIRGMVKLAVSHKALAVNFSDSLFVVASTPHDIRILSMVEIDRMLGAVDAWRTSEGTMGPKPTSLLGDVLRVMLGSGLRISEATALRKRDVHPPAEPGAPWTVSVEGTIVTPDSGPTYRKPEPKTSNSRRTVPVAAFAGEVLASRLALVADAGPDALIFYARTGNPVQSGNLRRTWRAIRGQDMLSDLNDVTPHALRRTVGTLLAAEVSPEYAAKYLGHGHGTSVLYSHYVRYLNTVDASGAAPLNNLMPKAIEP